jgi:hypothetical protein
MMLGSFDAIGSPYTDLWGADSDLELNTFSARISLDAE